MSFHRASTPRRLSNHSTRHDATASVQSGSRSSELSISSIRQQRYEQAHKNKRPSPAASLDGGRRFQSSRRHERDSVHHLPSPSNIDSDLSPCESLDSPCPSSHDDSRDASYERAPARHEGHFRRSSSVDYDDRSYERAPARHRYVSSRGPAASQASLGDQFSMSGPRSIDTPSSSSQDQTGHVAEQEIAHQELSLAEQVIYRYRSCINSSTSAANRVQARSTSVSSPSLNTSSNNRDQSSLASVSRITRPNPPSFNQEAWLRRLQPREHHQAYSHRQTPQASSDRLEPSQSTRRDGLGLVDSSEDESSDEVYTEEDNVQWGRDRGDRRTLPRRSTRTTNRVANASANTSTPSKTFVQNIDLRDPTDDDCAYCRDRCFVQNFNCLVVPCCNAVFHKPCYQKFKTYDYQQCSLCSLPFTPGYCSIVEDRLNAVPKPRNRVEDYTVDECYFALMNAPNRNFMKKNAKLARRRIIKRLKILGEELNEDFMRPVLP